MIRSLNWAQKPAAHQSSNLSEGVICTLKAVLLACRTIFNKEADLSYGETVYNNLLIFKLMEE